MTPAFKSINEIAHWMRNADPRVYDQFIALLKKHVDDITVAVIEAPGSEIRVAQGRAQEARKFLQLFVEAREPRNPAA